MSKWSVASTLKSNRSYWTLLRPKYCALDGRAEPTRNRAANTTVTGERIHTSRALIAIYTPGATLLHASSAGGVIHEPARQVQPRHSDRQRLPHARLS